jgi:hypothetical protein
VLLLVVAYFSPAVPALNHWLTGQCQEEKGEILIVLSADQLGNGTLGVVSYWRSLYAVRVSRQWLSAHRYQRREAGISPIAVGGACHG